MTRTEIRAFIIKMLPAFVADIGIEEHSTQGILTITVIPKADSELCKDDLVEAVRHMALKKAPAHCVTRIEVIDAQD